jgi:hypothetical protein
MIYGAHLVLYSRNAEADRKFLRDVLQFPAVDAGHGWLIFGLPPAEAAVHPQEGGAPAAAGEAPILRADFYLMCEDLAACVKSLEEKHVKCAPVQRERWGMRTSISLPSGGSIGLYQPAHPTALGRQPA